MNVTDAANGCNLQNWTAGASFSNIPLEITQNGSELSATVTGMTGTYLTGVIGANDLAGPLAGTSPP